MNEIEDVVSSVRRLVSPEARPRPLSRDLGLEKLILTPALLVVSEPAKSKRSAAKPKAKAAEPGRARKAVTPKADPIRVEPVAPVVEAEWEAPFWTEPEPALAELALQAEEAVVITSPEPTPEATPAPILVLVPDVASAAKPKPAAKSVAAAKKPARTSQSPAKKAPAAGATATKTAKPVLKSVKPSPKPRKAPAERAPVGAKPVLELVRSEPEVIETAPFAGIPAKEMPADVMPVAAADALPAAPLDNTLDMATVTQADATRETSALSPAVEELVVNGMAQVLTDRDGNPVSLLDEDELILMVRSLIREELKGVLGERITRNVRKLVRAEINRALTSQTLE